MSVANTIGRESTSECHAPERDDWVDDTITVSNYLRFKAPLERLAAVLLLIPGLPLMAALMVLIRLTSPGAAIFKQRRVGRHGRVFTMYKLRSMASNAETGTGPAWSTAKDMRVTPVGRWLRKLHLDELPQLLNVIKGEMSLIGPRPERPEFVRVLADQVAGYHGRLMVLPGITGLAQINLPPDSTLDDVRRKLVLDLEYIESASLWLEVRMLACTMMRMIGCPGAVATRLARVERSVELPDRPPAHSKHNGTTLTTLSGLMRERSSPAQREPADLEDTLTGEQSDTVEICLKQLASRNPK